VSGDTADQDVPITVDVLRGKRAISAACGSGHTVVLTDEGEVI
jgi:RCC1 and BTB domain-containing protein